MTGPQTVCPCCSGGLPICTDRKPDGSLYAHAETCAVYKWGNILCDECDAALTAETTAK